MVDAFADRNRHLKLLDGVAIHPGAHQIDPVLYITVSALNTRRSHLGHIADLLVERSLWVLGEDVLLDVIQHLPSFADIELGLKEI